MLITQEEADAAKKRAQAERLRITDPEKFWQDWRDRVAQQLRDAAVRGPIKILPF